MKRLESARDVVADDLETICAKASSELAALAGGRLLVVGGAGFLGYYLVQAALHFGKTRGTPIHVTVYDNYSRGVPAWLSELARDPHLDLVRHDITAPLPEPTPAFDWVFHAASIASPTYYRQFPIETMDANVGGLRRLLDYGARQADAGRPLSGFVFFSSSEIYGDPPPEHVPTPETYRGNVSCTGPRACYDEAKRFGETLCVTFAQKLGVPTRIARPYNNIGPGLKITDRRVLPDFARDVFAGRDLVMLSDGGPKRTFCYVADAVAGYFQLLVRGRPGESYNIGVESPEITIGELADRVVELGRELAGYRGKVVRKQAEESAYLVDNPVRRCPVIAKARTELGFDPSTTLDDMLRRSMLWYRDHQQAEEG